MTHENMNIKFIFPLLSRDSQLTISNKTLLYKLLLRSMITYAAPVWSCTSLTNYRHLQVYQSKCLRVIGNFPEAPLYHTYTIIYKYSQSATTYTSSQNDFSCDALCSTHTNPFIQNIGNYTTKDLHRKNTKYIHKHIKHILL